MYVDIEFDVGWRLAFGGLTEEMSQRIDHPEGGFVWRGERMEWAVAQAVRECFPPRTVTLGEKPKPEIVPPGSAVMEVGDRADIDILTKTGKRYVIDVRTVNVQCKTGVKQHASAQAHCAAIEQEKRDHYNKYFRNFDPFVVTLSGAVTHLLQRRC